MSYIEPLLKTVENEPDLRLKIFLLDTAVQEFENHYKAAHLTLITLDFRDKRLDIFRQFMAGNDKFALTLANRLLRDIRTEAATLEKKP